MKNHFIQMSRELMKAMNAKRCETCTGRVRLYRETKYLNPVWRCDQCGRTEDIILEGDEPVKVMEFK